MPVRLTLIILPARYEIFTNKQIQDANDVYFEYIQNNKLVNLFQSLTTFTKNLRGLTGF